MTSKPDSARKLCDRADSFIHPLLLAVWPNSRDLRTIPNRAALRAEIADFIFARFTQFGMVETRAQMRAREKQIAKIEKLSTNLIRTICCHGAKTRHQFTLDYSCSLRRLTTPPLSSLIQGLNHTARVTRHQLTEIRDGISNRPRGFDDITIRKILLPIYERHFGRRAGYSTVALTDEPTGPFVRFCQFMACEVDPFLGGKLSGHTIRAAIDRSRENEK